MNFFANYHTLISDNVRFFKMLISCIKKIQRNITKYRKESEELYVKSQKFDWSEEHNSLKIKYIRKVQLDSVKHNVSMSRKFKALIKDLGAHSQEYISQLYKASQYFLIN